MIFDCFTYFNDDLITELRLNILDKYVDKFVIVEATTDHSGKKKDLNFNIKKFEKFEKKYQNRPKPSKKLKIGLKYIKKHFNFGFLSKIS